MGTNASVAYRKQLAKQGIWTALLLVAFPALSGPLDNAWLKGSTDKNPVAYKPGEEMVFTIEPQEIEGEVPDGIYLLWWRRSDDYGATEEGVVPFTTRSFVYKTSLAHPGFVRLEAYVLNKDGSRFVKKFTGDAVTPEGRKAMNEFERSKKNVFFDGGAGVDIDKLALAPEAEPADFDAFWARQFARLDKVGLTDERIEIASANPEVRVYAVRVDCAGLRPVTGYLSIPKTVDGGATFPCRLVTDGYSGDSCTQERPGWCNPKEITLRINAHGLKLPEFGATDADTKALRCEVRSNGWTYAFDPEQNNDPETAYFNGMVLRVKRALHYLKTVKGWNGRDLFASGGSQGGLIVVAKHHDGFCLWPTKTTEHNITKSPFGKDYVKEMEQACRRAGVKFGVYVSPWDRNSAHYATEKYVDIYHRQIKELLSGDYGEVFEMWFDGANGGDGWYGGASEKRRIGTGYYRFDEVFGFVRELQPKVCIFAGEEDASDFRWPGNERGVLDPDSRATICTVGGYAGGKYGNPDYKDQINSGSPNGKSFRVCEADFPLRRGWFYHEKERGTTKSSAYLAKLYVGTVGNGGTMNIGIAPNKDGRLDADDLKALSGFKVMKDALFAREAQTGDSFNVVVMSEDLTKGEQVDSWEFVADGKTILSGRSIGMKRIRLLRESVAAKSCEVKVLKDGGELQGVSVHCYFADPELVKTILDSDEDSGETDTAKWMRTGQGN